MAERDEEMIRGTVQSIVRLRTEGGDQITVTGTIPMTLVGERLVIAGKWGRHPSHGPQFEAEFLERLMPETTQEIFSYLSSRAVKGIGAKTAAKIVERFGAQSLDVLENEPSRLAEIPGITRSKAAEMSASFRRQSGVRRLIEFLTIHRLPPELAVRLYRIYGPDAQDQSQPWTYVYPGRKALRRDGGAPQSGAGDHPRGHDAPFRAGAHGRRPGRGLGSLLSAAVL